MKRKIFLLSMLLSALLAAREKAFCQQNNQPTGKTISLSEFEMRVDRATDLLKFKELRFIADTDHINIIKCLNTISFTRARAFVNEPRFKGERYEKLEEAKYRKDYERSMLKIYPQFSQNNGKGIYFKKLDIELYGSPDANYLFLVAN